MPDDLCSSSGSTQGTFCRSQASLNLCLSHYHGEWKDALGSLLWGCKRACSVPDTFVGCPVSPEVSPWSDTQSALLLCARSCPFSNGCQTPRWASHWPSWTHVHFCSLSSWRQSLVSLCQMCMDKKVDFWVCALPVLHHGMDLSPPAQGSVTQPEDTWAALEGISFSEFRERTPDQ